MSACDDMTDGNLFSLSEWAYENGIFAKTYCDQIGRIHLDIDSLILDDTARDALDTYIDITEQDWKFEAGIQIDRRKDTQSAIVLASGVASIDNVFTPLMAQAPGAIPDNFGDDSVNIERLVLSSQAQLNTLVGRLYAIANSDISEIRLDFSGDYPITLSPKVWYTFTIPASYTKRGIDIDVRMQCRSITYNVSVTSGIIYPSCIFEVDVDSVDGVTLTYPDDTETPYAPVPPYTPAIPYLPNIPPIYPIIPISPYPNYPSGPPTYIIPGAPTIPAINAQCRTIIAYPTNGPYFVYSGEAAGGSTIIPISFFLRGTNYSYPTKYTINGYFYRVNPADGSYELTTDDNFYDVYALDASGTRVATGIHDAVVGNGYQRTGTFNAPSGVNISSIEFVCKIPELTYYTTKDDVPYPVSSSPIVYSYISDEGTLTTIETPDGGVAWQLTSAKCAIANPPWSWGTSITLSLRTSYTVLSFPNYYDLIVVVYPFQTIYESINITVRNPVNKHILSQYGQLQTFSGRIKNSGYGSPYDDTTYIGVSIDYPTVGIGGWTEVSMFVYIKPVVPKITIDSLLLWNVCSHS